MSSLTLQLVSGVLQIIRLNHELLCTLDVLVVCVLVMCMELGRVLMINNPRAGFAFAWISSIGTISFWILAIFILRRAGVA